MTRKVLIVLLLMYAYCIVGCTQRYYTFDIRPIDPPIQPAQGSFCIQFGYDGLACMNKGYEI